VGPESSVTISNPDLLSNSEKIGILLDKMMKIKLKRFDLMYSLQGQELKASTWYKQLLVLPVPVPSHGLRLW
jgi:hypothetical protein